MYIAKNNDLIIMAKPTREELMESLEMLVYTSIEETSEDYELYNGQYHPISEMAEIRQADFESNFLATSLGNYRLHPKGYANAQQSIDTVNNIVMAMGGLDETIAQMVIFYATPDFSKPEECTEEWLVQHQSHPEPMTLQEWVQFYIEFTTLYARKVYKTDEPST